MRVFGPLPPARWVPGPLWRVAATRRDDEERLLRWLCEPCARWEPCWELRAPLELCDAEFEARCELLESYASLPALRVDDALRALRGRDEALRFCEAMLATVAGAPEKSAVLIGIHTNRGGWRAKHPVVACSGSCPRVGSCGVGRIVSIDDGRRIP